MSWKISPAAHLCHLYHSDHNQVAVRDQHGGLRPPLHSLGDPILPHKPHHPSSPPDFLAGDHQHSRQCFSFFKSLRIWKMKWFPGHHPGSLCSHLNSKRLDHNSFWHQLHLPPTRWLPLCPQLAHRKDLKLHCVKAGGRGGGGNGLLVAGGDGQVHWVCGEAILWAALQGHCRLVSWHLPLCVHCFPWHRLFHRPVSPFWNGTKKEHCSQCWRHSMTGWKYSSIDNAFYCVSLNIM